MVSSAIFNSPGYLTYLTRLSGGKELPRYGRVFESVYKNNLLSLAERIEQLKVYHIFILLVGVLGSQLFAER